jgi:hypothetical protein
MPFKEIIAVSTEIHMKSINTLRWQTAELENVKNTWYIYVPLCFKVLRLESLEVLFSVMYIHL